MSGFEIAGAVLGAIPIAITALDKYKEANKRFAFWRGIRQEHKRFSSDLEFQRCNFELNLKQLLLPLLMDNESIQVLLANPGGDEWKRPEIEKALKERLAGSYEHYLSIMEGLQKAVGALNQELSLGLPAVQEAAQNPKKSGLLSRHFNRDNMGYQIYRLKLSADGGSKAKQLLDELTQRNEQLEKLLKQTDKVTHLSQLRDEGGLTKTAVKLDAAMLSFWKKATALYKILQTTWSNCSCSGNHITNMLLKHQQTAHEREQFNFIFATSDSASPWNLRRALVTVGDNATGATGAPKLGTDVLAVGGPVPLDRGDTTTCQPGHRRAKALKSALRTKTTIGGGQKFMDPCPTTTVESLAVAAIRSLSMDGGHSKVKIASMTAPLGQPTVATTERITNLCESLRRDGPDRLQCAGFLHDDDNEDCKYYLYPEANGMVLRHKFISLQQLISEEELPPLSFKQRLFISLALASSFLKLLESPWIPYQWTKEDIVFFPDPDDPDVFILEKPYVKGPSAKEEDPGAAALDPGCRAVRSLAREEKRQESLSQLGIVLEELCFRCSIEKRRAQRRHQAPRSRQERLDTDVALGIGWLRDISKEAAGLEYGEAIKWCLVDNRVSAGGSDAWRREMLKHVVGPLERSCRQFPLDS
ncbi:hypothetical protein MAPG_02267 [Magnaporthiopsis poae ATCC 64411]|uniref:DUF7580 domain-containing protein n=1 Tax=Magnaporthiopsis poae (strain ATCC 64411 / 73-15) TaxID=644358 RepID=A0A0C4DQW9_MAGP6|nr:hypothetical protein MAPG_02267 [Magnaporthiopsis poae ATCC 64411]